MTLVTSCNGIYFSKPAMDNIITLTWLSGENSNVPAPYSGVVFKVKSSAPKLFYVSPRYGALLLTDASGIPHERCSVEVTFGLRPGVSDTPTAAAASTRQERFAIEYFSFSGDCAACERLLAGLTDIGQLSEAVKNVWDSAKTGALRVTRGAPILLKVYRESNTVVDGHADSAAGPMVVPSSARLVKPSLQELVMARSSAISRRGSSFSTPSVVTSTVCMKRTQDGQMRTPSHKVDCVHQESFESASLPASVLNSSCQSELNAFSQNSEKSIIMCIPQVDDGISKDAKFSLPLYLVIFLMFVTYILTMLRWRGIDE